MSIKTAVIVSLLAILLNGCCGMTNIQAHGGGAGGFASLGAMVLGSAAMQRLCEGDRDTGQDDETPPPPDTTGETESGYNAPVP